MMTTSRTTHAVARFTPRAWFARSNGRVGTLDGTICEVRADVGKNKADRIAQAGANMMLIAAAPDLYDALRAALVVVAGCNADGIFNQQERQIRYALAAAEARHTWTPPCDAAATNHSDSEGGEA